MEYNKRFALLTLTRPNSPKSQELEDLTEELAIFLKFTPLQFCDQQYPNGGITAIRFLAESHIVIDTYPETNIIEVNIVSCNDMIDADLMYAMTKWFEDKGFVVINQNYAWKNKDQQWVMY